MAQDLRKRLEQIFENQRILQRTHGFPIDSINPADKDRMAEIYIYKMVEECIELRRTQPSSLIPMSKSQPEIDRTAMISEGVDIQLYFINWMIARGVTPDELLDQLDAVQANNLAKAHERGAAMENNK